MVLIIKTTELLSKLGPWIKAMTHVCLNFYICAFNVLQRLYGEQEVLMIIITG